MLWIPMQNESVPNDPVLLTTAADDMEAKIIESKLRSENIPCLLRYQGTSDIAKTYCGNSNFPVEILVPASAKEAAQEIITSVGEIPEQSEETAPPEDSSYAETLKKLLLYGIILFAGVLILYFLFR